MRWKYRSRELRKIERSRRIVEKKYRPMVDWHSVFLWWPRRVGDHRVWLETVERRPSLISLFREAVSHESSTRAENIIRKHGFDYRLPPTTGGGPW